MTKTLVSTTLETTVKTAEIDHAIWSLVLLGQCLSNPRAEFQASNGVDAWDFHLAKIFNNTNFKPSTAHIIRVYTLPGHELYIHPIIIEATRAYY